MAATTTSAPLSFSRETFATLSPAPFLLAHLKPTSSKTSPVRPNGRAPLESREPKVNTGSLSHSNGSAVVRVGDTAVVCGVRAEILLASDIPHPYTSSSFSDRTSSSEIESLGLLVPNLELSTGCSPAHLPGNPPSTLAQSLSQRILSLLHTTNLLSIDDLRITALESEIDDDIPDAPASRSVTKAYWTLYIDTLVMSLDGNAFDAAWAAVLAALRDTRFPSAEWDADNERVVCSPETRLAKTLRLRTLPVAVSFGVFSTYSQMKSREEAEEFVLADLDGFEEELCDEQVTVIVAPKEQEGNKGRGGVLRIEKSGGGGFVGREKMRELVGLAQDRWSDWESVLRRQDR